MHTASSMRYREHTVAACSCSCSCLAGDSCGQCLGFAGDNPNWEPVNRTGPRVVRHALKAEVYLYLSCVLIGILI